MTKNTLGFGMSPRPKRIFIGKELGALWYFWNVEKAEPEAILESSLTGYLRGIDKVELTSDYGTSEKLKILIDADRRYEIVCGFSTWFAKTFLMSIDRLSDEQITRLLSIEPLSNSNKRVIFASVFDWVGNKIYTGDKWKDEKGNPVSIDWDLIYQRVRDRLGVEEDLELEDEKIHRVIEEIDAIDKKQLLPDAIPF